jgi:hypothetical protein
VVDQALKKHSDKPASTIALARRDGIYEDEEGTDALMLQDSIYGIDDDL